MKPPLKILKCRFNPVGWDGPWKMSLLCTLRVLGVYFGVPFEAKNHPLADTAAVQGIALKRLVWKDLEFLPDRRQ